MRCSPAAFNSDIGVDNEPLRTRDGGYVWYDVTGIDPARDKSFEEVRDAVVAQWRHEEISRRLTEKARALVERIDKGETVEAIAAELGVPVQTATDLARSATQTRLGRHRRRIFSTPVGKAASALPGDDSRARFFKVDGRDPAASRHLTPRGVERGGAASREL